MVDVYKEAGFQSRKDYLNYLSDEYGVDIDIVNALAGLLGPSEDFDGLISSLDDFSNTNDIYVSRCRWYNRNN